MRPIDAKISLADLVTDRPELAPALESLGLDYCCGGQTSLREACSERDLEVGEVVDLLGDQAPADPEQWTSMSPPALVDHLERTHHAYLLGALSRLCELMDRVLDAHASSQPKLHEVSTTLRNLRRDLEPHLIREEQILFPMIRRLYASDELAEFHCGSIQNPIGVMEIEHEQAGILLAQLRRLTSDYRPPGDACASYNALFVGLAQLEADTHLHIHKENNVLFPAVLAEEARLQQV